MDSYCTNCLVQFDNMSVYNMHLSTVHKENVEIKQESSCDILEKMIEEPKKVILQCKNCDKTFSTRSNLKTKMETIIRQQRPQVRFPTHSALILKNSTDELQIS